MRLSRISRRDFLAIGGLSAGAWVAPRAFGADSPQTHPGLTPSTRYPETTSRLTISDPSRFTVLQLTDSHFYQKRDDVPHADDRTRTEWKQMVDLYKPDMIAMTGDLWHNNPDGRGVEFQADSVGFVSSLGVPWTYNWGNHDELTDSAAGHDVFHDAKYSLYCGGPGGGNYTVDVVDKQTKRVWELICVNTHDEGLTGPSYGWLEDHAKRSTDKATPRFAFFHIPLKQYIAPKVHKTFSGISFEGVAYQKEDGTSLELFKGIGGVRACFVGHDHLNDCTSTVDGIDLVFGRSSGWNGYGYDKLRKGGKLITANCETGNYTWETVFPDGLRWKPGVGDHIEQIIDQPWIKDPQAKPAAA